MSLLSFRWKLRDKILLLFILVAFIPFSVINFYLYTHAQETVKKNVEQSLATATSQESDTINNYFNFKLLGMLSHSQGAALLSGNEQLIKDDLLNFLLQDSDIISLTFVTPDGQEFVKVDRNKIYPKQSLVNRKNSDEFKIAAFKFGREYISNVDFNSQGEAEITISTPILYPKYSSSFQTISSSQQIARSADEIFGVLIERVSLEKLQNSIANMSIGATGYMYLVDSDGRVIAHRDKILQGTIPEAIDNTELKRFITTTSQLEQPISPTPNIGISLNNIPVLSAHIRIARTNWAIISEQTLDEVLSDIRNIQNQAIILFLLSLCVVIALSFMFARSLTSPVEKLAEASVHIGQGDFDFPFTVSTGDELEHLASAYKEMALRLKHDQSAIMAEKNTLSMVLNNTADAVIGLDKDFKIVLFNRVFKQMMQLDDRDIKGHTFDDVVTIREKEKIVSVEQYCENIDEDLHKVLVTNAESTSKNVIIVAVKVPPNIKTQIRYILTLYDLTKEQELEAMKVDFVSMAAHELRTPLTVIRNYLSVFLSENKAHLNDDQKMLLGRIEIASQDLVALVESLLSATRMEKMGFELKIKPNDWFALIQKIVGDLKNSAQEKNITIRLKPLEETMPLVLADEQRITEVVVNLLTNAIKYSNPNSDIEIYFAKEGSLLKTYIQDHGPGIPKEVIPKLFTKFYRVPGLLQQTARGTGLGLYISKKLVEMHKGTIWVDSEINKGSTFGFALPTTVANSV